MSIRELQTEAKKLEKSNPDRACELYKEALELDGENAYSISGYGRSLRRAQRPFEFIDFCDGHGNATIFEDQYIVSAYCWCLYDFFIKKYPDNLQSIPFDLFIEKALFIVEHFGQRDGNNNYQMLYVLTVFKVVKEFGKQELYDEQLKWLNYLDPDGLSDNTQEKIGETDTQFSSYKEQYYTRKAWILYRKYIKQYNEENGQDGFAEFIDAAKEITSIVNQSAEDTDIDPYTLTVIKVVKNYVKRENKNYKSILEWIQKINPQTLSEKVYSITTEDGKEREQASHKELYYQYISKAYEKLGSDRECIKVCDEGLSEIKKWHYRNDVWVRARREYCNCRISDNFEQDIIQYQKLADRTNHWFMFHKVASLYASNGNFQQAVYYASKALTCDRINTDTMINLFYDFGIYLQSSSHLSDADVFFQACAYYRTRNGWKLSEELRFVIQDKQLDTNSEPKLYVLQNIAKRFLPTPIKRSYGKVMKLLIHGDGFITSEKSQYYFKSKQNKGFFIDCKVSFVPGKDNRGRNIALDIRKE